MPGVFPARCRVSVVAGSFGLSELVDPRVGIIRSCRRLTKDRQEPGRPYIYQATLSHYDLRKASHTERAATGKGMSEAGAREGAIVEALERYCGSQRRSDLERVGSRSSLDAASIAPEELVLYSDRQYGSAGFAHRRPVADEQLTWVCGRLVGSGQPVFAPASLVYLTTEGSIANELFTLPTSNGLGGGRTLPSAVLAGLYELIERDAFVITWLNRLPAPRIAFPSDAGAASEIRHHYRRVGIETHAFALPSDLDIPVVLAVAVDRGGRRPHATIGLGCNLDPTVALDRAMMEVVQLRTALVHRHRTAEPPLLRRYEDVSTPLDHADLFADPDNRHELAFLLDGVAEIPLARILDCSGDDASADLDYCRQRLEAAGCTVAFVDLTQPDLEAFGVRIVRAIATGLQPIHFGFGCERLGGGRVYTVPPIVGHAECDRSEDGLNRCPHPLA
jgi:ribosomal protein S12 methylthiotransferase accessory factor